MTASDPRHPDAQLGPRTDELGDALDAAMDQVMHEVWQDALLSLDELCRACAVPPDWLHERLSAGLLTAPAVRPSDDPAAWRFDAIALRRVRSMVRLERDFDAVPELAALVADLEEEVQRLRAQLRRAGLL